MAMSMKQYKQYWDKLSSRYSGAIARQAGVSGGGGPTLYEQALTDQRKHQQASIKRMMKAIEWLKQNVYGSQLAQTVKQGVTDMMGGDQGRYERARRRQLGVDIAGMSQSADVREQSMKEQMSARGLTSSGLMGEKMETMEKARMGAVGQLRNQAGMDIASRSFSDRLAALQSAMGFMGQQQGMGMDYVNQMGGVLGNIQYPQVPQVPSTAPEAGALGQLRRQTQQMGRGNQPATDPRSGEPANSWRSSAEFQQQSAEAAAKRRQYFERWRNQQTAAQKKRNTAVWSPAKF